MATSPANFVWHELLTSDAEAAESFYRAVIGWDMHDSGMPGWRYTILAVGAASIGGMMALPPEACAAGAQPAWVGYIGVEDVDAHVARVTAAGGAIHRPAQDIPGVGRFAVTADPQGAGFVLFAPSGTEPPERPAAGVQGSVGWNELHAAHWQSAFAFYADLFGWEKAETIDMGPMGVYQLFAAGAAPIGGAMSDPAGSGPPHWLYYFNVDALDAAAARVTEQGGEILQGPHSVPGGNWIVHCRDPQGALFALVSTQR